MANIFEKLIICLHCGNKTTMKRVAVYKHQDDDFEYDHETGEPYHLYSWFQEWALYMCPACNNVTMEKCEWDSYARSDMDYKTSVIYPFSSSQVQTMPKNVHNAFEAALKVRHIDGAICALSLRRTLEMMCKDRGASEYGLMKKLKELSDRGDLPPIVDGMANILNQLGNSAAHADDAEFSKELVDSMIEFTRTILDYVYILPQKLAHLQTTIGLQQAPVAQDTSQQSEGQLVENEQ